MFSFTRPCMSMCMRDSDWDVTSRHVRWVRGESWQLTWLALGGPQRGDRRQKNSRPGQGHLPTHLDVRSPTGSPPRQRADWTAVRWLCCLLPTYTVIVYPYSLLATATGTVICTICKCHSNIHYTACSCSRSSSWQKHKFAEQKNVLCSMFWSFERRNNGQK